MHFEQVGISLKRLLVSFDGALGLVRVVIGEAEVIPRGARWSPSSSVAVLSRSIAASVSFALLDELFAVKQAAARTGGSATRERRHQQQHGQYTPLQLFLGQHSPWW